MLEVRIYTEDDIASQDAASGIKIECDYVSLVDAGTHGPPALVAPGRDTGQRVAPVARAGDKVVYVNTSKVAAFSIERTES